jgi:O-antigen ligase
MLLVALAVPLLPQSFWARMDSITNAETDPTGSRAARIRLINQAIEVFAENPLTGIGAGQFENYSGEDIIERNRATHNVWLQVAAELGIVGFAIFAYLVARAFRASATALRALRPPRRRPAATKAAPRPPSRAGKRRVEAAPDAPPLTEEERFILDINARGMIAGMVGWFVCAMFASVAFNWTFYYVLALAVAGREIALSRRVEAPAGAARALPAVPRLAVSRA